MLHLRTFHELSPGQRLGLLAFVRPFRGPDSLEALEREYGSPAFTGGLTHWSGWREDRVTASLGAVTSARGEKGELYLTQAFGALEDLDLLLDHALHALEPYLPCRIKLSANHLVPGLVAWAQAHGFQTVYHLLELARDGAAPRSPGLLDWQAVTPDNAEAFREVHARAFLASPNAVGLDASGMAALLDQYRDCPQRLQLGLLEGRPAVALETELDDRREGTIASLGVHPGLQGRGLGREGLHHALRLLEDEGALRARLTVIDANDPALALYLAEGFHIVRTLSTVLSQDR